MSKISGLRLYKTGVDKDRFEEGINKEELEVLSGVDVQIQKQNSNSSDEITRDQKKQRKKKD